MRRGVSTALTGLGCEIVGQAADGLEAISNCKAMQPTLLMLDVSMPRAGAIEVIEEVRRWAPDTKIIILTGITNATVLQPIYQAGIAAMVLKDSPVETLEKAILKSIDNKFFLDPKIEGILTESTAVVLSRREQQILGLLLRGNNNLEVAKLINISPHTVNNHRSSIMRKLDAHSIVELMTTAMRLGLVSPPSAGTEG